MFVLAISPYVWSILILDYDLVYTSLLFSLCLSLATYLQNSNSLYTCFNLSFMCYPQHPLRPYRWHNVSNVLCRNTPWMMGTTLYEPAKSVCTIFWNTIFQTTILIKAELYDLSRLKGVYNSFFFFLKMGMLWTVRKYHLSKFLWANIHIWNEFDVDHRSFIFARLCKYVHLRTSDRSWVLTK